MAKSQFQSGHNLEIRIPPFINKDDGTYIEAGDGCTMTLIDPLGAVVSVGFPSRMTSTFHWSLNVPPPNPFVPGIYLLRAVSTGIGTAVPQYREYTWGEAMIDGLKVLTSRWKIDTIAKTCTIYDDDGTTPLYVFDVKDESGALNAFRIFERVLHP